MNKQEWVVACQINQFKSQNRLTAVIPLQYVPQNEETSKAERIGLTSAFEADDLLPT